LQGAGKVNIKRIVLAVRFALAVMRAENKRRNGSSH